MMKKTTLQFNNLSELVQFQKAIEMTSFRINASAFTLTGQFSEQEIALARTEYQGTILVSEPTLQEQDY